MKLSLKKKDVKKISMIMFSFYDDQVKHDRLEKEECVMYCHILIIKIIFFYSIY